MRIYEIAPGQKTGINILKRRNTDAEDVDNAKVDKLVALIQTQCSDVISAYKETGKFLYRGLSDIEEDQWIFKGRPRKERETHTDSGIVQIFNIGFAKAKFKANRTNTIACTSNLWWTEQFGDPFIVFPKDGFNFIWSPNVKDFGMVFQQEGGPRAAAKWVETYRNNPLMAIKDYGYTNENFSDAILSGNEVNIVSEYYGLLSDSYIGRIVIDKVMGK
jgi:hypothetical protein